MPPTPPPAGARGRPRTAAVQTADRPPSSRVVGRGRSGGISVSGKVRDGGVPDASSYLDWQDWARHYARTKGIARFAVGIVSNIAERVLLRVEERDENGDWDESHDPRFTGIFDAYRNERQTAPELVGMHTHHYQVAGECAQVISDGPNGVDWSIFSMRAIDFDKPHKGDALVKLTPNGSERDGTAFVVPRKQVVRFWTPDVEWQAYASSPMSASIEDLHRYQVLVRSVMRTAKSRLVMNGVFFTPGEAHEHVTATEQSPDAGVDDSISQLDKDWATIARRAYHDDDDIWASAPFPMHYDTAGGTIPEPKWVQVGRDLDANVLEHIRAAAEDYARGVDLPTQLVVSGGPGDANHWTEWLVDQKFFDSGVAPTLNRVTHTDMTQTFLVPVLRAHRLPPDRFRVGYDKSPVVVKPDQSDLGLRMHLAGLLKGDRALEAANFDLNDRMGPLELGSLLKLLSKQSDGEAPRSSFTFGSPAGGQAVDTGAPASPATLAPAPPMPPPALAAAGALDEPPSPSSTALRRLTQARRDVGRELLAMAEGALAEAMRAAGVKVQVRARGRSTATARAAALAAVDADTALGPHLAAVGVTEAELLDRRFEAFRSQARRKLDQAAGQQRAALRASGAEDLVPDDPQAREQAVAYLTAALTALAYQRLADGPLVPAAGEVTGEVPARFVTGALEVAAGRAEVQLAEGADVLPTLTATGAPTIERAVVDAVDGEGAPITWQWEWGFYGDPVAPFEPHQDLGLSGFTTTDRDGDPDLANTDSFPEADYYHPQDHDGCTCTWVPVSDVESGPGTRPIEFPT